MRIRGEESAAELCRREGLAPNLYYRWSKEFLEAGKKRLLGDTTREATAPEGRGLLGGESTTVPQDILVGRVRPALGSWRVSANGAAGRIQTRRKT